MQKIVFPKQLLDPLHKFLEGELSKIKKQKKQAEKSDPTRDPSRLSMNSLEENVDEQLDHESAQMRVNFLGKRLVQVRKALTRLKIGKYGLCEKCGNMIDTDRLSVYPETTLCIKCQSEKE